MCLAHDPKLSRGKKGKWKEITGRAKYGKTLIMDTTGMLDRMCPDDYGTGVQFGEGVLEIARKV